MNNLFELFLFAFCLFAGSTIMGIVPLWFTTEKWTLDLVSIYGAGLLIGVALIIIIPEGMITLYEATHGKPGYNIEFLLGISLVFGFMLMFFIDKVFEILGVSSHPEHLHGKDHFEYEEVELSED